MICTNCSDNFDRIGQEIKHGKIVVFPTDTVFGVGTDPLSKAGIVRLFEMKKRNLEKKLPVLFSNTQTVSKFVELDDRARHIASVFWPGQITMILPVTHTSIPRELLGDDNSLAVRIPSHACCLKLISACGGALIGTSANLSGSKPFIDPDNPDLLEFARQTDYFVKGNCGKSALPSTILDLTSPRNVSILREGAVSRKTVEDYLSKTSKTDFSLSATKS